MSSRFVIPEVVAFGPREEEMEPPAWLTLDEAVERFVPPTIQGNLDVIYKNMGRLVDGALDVWLDQLQSSCFHIFGADEPYRQSAVISVVVKQLGVLLLERREGVHDIYNVEEQRRMENKYAEEQIQKLNWLIKEWLDLHCSPREQRR